MATKKRQAKNKKPQPAQIRSPILSSVTATVLDMVATSATLESVLLSLVVVKHFI
jgi:hypothetical protein